MADPLFSVEGKVCLVTGASTGLGAGFAQHLLARGALVVNLSDVAPDWDAGEMSNRFADMRGDVRDESDVNGAIGTALKAFGGFDVLVNNAAGFVVEKAARQDAAGFGSIMDVNVTAVANVCRKAHAVMRANGGGAIVNVTSVLGRRPMRGLSAYATSKAALEQLTRALALEWASDGVRVNALAPGWYPTAMTRGHLDSGLAALLKTSIPMGRLGMPDDLAGALLLLVSDASRYMTGTTITVDGGYDVRS
ncbi:MAG: SDR family oxidoreductase [Roseitalea sp.]|nr:SDR family oxidoreductase [Roseitalea sp.]MBO6722436.1 SDR family oxidoreductase [Roseitalea sp.]MBO6741950.1 SDR family oxidoreductase [Roseitalea sp.]